MIINSKFAYVKKKETFEPLITTIPKGLNPIVFIEDTREMWTCGTYFSIGYPSIEISESSGSVKVSIGNSFFLLSTAGESISVRKGDGNRIIISSNALNRVDTEAPLTWDTANRKLLHMDSGVAPGSYGQSTNLGNASVFIVPNIMIDSTGHITYAQNYNVEIRDYVEQLAPSTLAGNRNVLLSYNADSESMDTSQVRKANGLLFNDSTQRLTVEGGLDTNGPVFVNHGDLSVLDGYIIGHLKGDVEGEAKPKIHLSNKPEYGGASINLYGHVKLQDVLNNKPEPSSDNENINDPNITNAIAASPLMVWNAIQTAKDYADSILGSNNAMLYKGSIEAGITYPGTYTPIGQIGNTYVVTFGSGNYIDSVGYVNGEPVEVGDLIICKEETPAATSTTWETVKSKWTYVQTNNTGVVSGPSSSTIGQLAVFNNTKGKLIKGLPNGNVGQILSIDESGIPAWVNKPDRLNFALSFQVRGTEFIAFDGYEPKKVNFIAGDNMFITSDMQGNLTLAADPGSDTVNTAGATNNPNTKLFLIGAESQTTAPQTYSNQYVYIGPDNKLYSNGKEVSTTDHNHDDRYVNTSGDTMTGVLSITCSDTYPLTLNNSLGHLAIIIKNANTNKSRFGWNQEYGSYIYDYTADRYINIKSDSLYWNNTDSFLHTGNYTTTLDTRYVKKSGDSMSGVLSITTSDIHPIVITSSNEQETSINVASKGTIGYHSSRGMFLYNKASNKVLEINDDGNAYFDKNKIWHAGNDGPDSGLNADTLDDVQLLQKGSTSGVMRSWRRGSFTTVNQYFGNGALVVIDPAPTDSTELWANTTIFSVGDSAARNWQMAFGYGADVIKVRKNNDGWGSWKTLAFLDSKVASSTNSDYPTGFSSRSTSSTWGNTTGTHITGWGTSTGGAIAFMNDNPSAGKVSIKIDGLFYQDEGRYKVLDTNNYSATLDGRYLRIGETATSGTNSKYLSFANNVGGVGGTMGVNDQWRIYGRSTADNAGYLEIATANDGNEPIYFRQYTGVFSTLKRTLTLLDGSGNTSMPGSLTVAGTTTSGNFNTGGRYISSYGSSTWINSVTNSVLTCNYSGYGGILCAPVKGGRITLSTYPSNDNIVYLGYATSSQISAGTNALNKQTRWNADNGYWYTDGYVKNGSSDSYVLLGGGGHTTLSGLYTSHNHFERSNVDPNSIVNGPRTYETTNTANRPDTNTWHQYTTLGTGDNNYCHQLSYAYAGGTNIYHRVKNAGSWGGWITILDSSNYAGMLDGRYVNVTGDTINGNVTIVTDVNAFGGNGLTLKSNSSTDAWLRYANTSNTLIGIIGIQNGIPKFGKGGTLYTLWHSGNDGSGSGLDADLLDGLHASSLGIIYSFNVHNVYYCFGTANMPQNGASLHLIVTTGNGYNANASQCRNFDVYLRTSNGSANGGKYYAGHVEYGYYGSGRCNVYVVQNSLTSFTIWMGITNYTGTSHFIVNHSSNVSFTYGGQTSSSLPSGAAQLQQVQHLYSDKVFNTLTLQANGTTIASYNGSSAITCNFNYSNIGAASAVHTHDDRYFTESESDNRYFRDRGIINQANPNVLVNGAYYSDYTSPVAGAYTYGILLNFRAYPNNFQMYHPDNSSDLWFRSNWNSQSTAGGTWTKIWSNRNFDPNTKFNTSGGTISGAVTINNTLSVSKIKATSTYSSDYVFCADGSIRNFAAMTTSTILFATYKLYTGGSGTYSRLNGNYNFITSVRREAVGRVLLTISVPSGYIKNQIMMFATGHHKDSDWTSPVYASIQPDIGTSNSVRIMTADDSSLNDAECIVNFLLIKGS